jgi:hypothetical protein
MTVYGPAQDNFKTAFLSELVLHSAIHWLCTWVVLQKFIFLELFLATCQCLEQVTKEDLVFRLITTSV